MLRGSSLRRMGWSHTRVNYACRREVTKRRTRVRRAQRDTISLRDSVGMLIPEARLRRERVSPDIFDRSIAEKARGILGLDADGVGGQGPYGAQLDRRDICFQGKNGDVRRFAEMAARAASTENWSGASLLRGDSPLANAVAFVGGEHAKKQGAKDTSDASKETVRSGSNAMLQRVMKHRGRDLSPLIHVTGNNDNTNTNNKSNNTDVGEAKQNVVAESSMSEGKRRVERRQRRLERILNRETSVHPCVHQGGCKSQGGASMCPFVMYPAEVCVAWLRHGHCEDALRGCCPWWHGDVADTSKADVVGISLFCGAKNTEGDDSRLLRESCAWTEKLLQMFFDVAVTTVEDAQFELTEGLMTVAMVRQIIQKALSGVQCNVDEGAVNIPLHYNPTCDALFVERDLAVSALMAEAKVETMKRAEGKEGEKYNEEEEESFDVMFSRELASLRRGVETTERNVTRDDEKKRIHTAAERSLRSVLAVFRGYITAGETQGPPGEYVALCAPLTQWLLQRVADDYNGKIKNDGGCTAEPAMAMPPQNLFEEASTILLYGHIEKYKVLNSEGENGTTGAHRWSSLSLLQLMSVLVRIPALREGSVSPSHSDVSFLFTKLLSFHIEKTPSWSSDNVQSQYMSYWVFLHSLLSKLALGLVREGVQQFALARFTLVSVTRQLARTIEDHFSMPLLRASGWSGWTDEQMFASQQMRAYTAVDYAQFHMPTIAHCFTASVLNTCMLHILKEAVHRNHLRLSVLSAVFFSRSQGLESPEESLWRERCLQAGTHGGGGAMVQRSLRPYVVEALAILSCLHDENNAVLAKRQEFVEEFMRRRKDYQERLELEILHQRKSNNTQNRKRNNKSLPSDDNDCHVFEKLLPHASVMISADVTCLLLRVLFRGGGAYRALRLATSVIHVSRMLRHASKQPMPYLIQDEKTVHKRVRHGGTGRKHVIRVRVPVLRRVDTEAEERMRGGGPKARPVGVYMQLSEGVVAEIASLGARMGETGAKLVHGVCGDCVRGSLIDYSAGRCFPAPNASDVHNDGSITTAFGARVLRSILSLAGLGTSSGSTTSNIGQQPGDAVVPAILGRRIPPTALLMETVVALTPTKNRESHALCERICSMEQSALVNERVVLAQQYHMARHHYERASGLASAVWLDVIRAGDISLTRSSIIMLQKEIDHLPAPLDFTEEPPALASRPTQQRQKRGRAASPRTVEELRHHLQQSDEEGGAVSTDDGRHHGGYTTYMAQCLSAHTADENALRRMRWVILAATLLNVTQNKLTGIQSLWSRLLLRNTFIMATQATSDQEREQDMQATLRMLLITDNFCPDTNTVAKEDEQLPSWCFPVVRGLPQFLAAQVHLAEKLSARFKDEALPQDIRRGIHLLPQFKNTIGLHAKDVAQTNLWSLFDPFLEHPELTVSWLRISLFGVRRDFLVWLTAHVDTRDTQTLFSLAVWTEYLYYNTVINDALRQTVLQTLCRKLTPDQVHKLSTWTQVTNKKTAVTTNTHRY